LIQSLYQRTEGNPLFLMNLVDDLVAREVIAFGGEVWIVQNHNNITSSEIPENIRHLIAKQSRRLLSEEQRVLQAASVAGMEFSAAAIAAALETEVAEVEEWCAGLAARQLFLRRMGISQWPDGTIAERYVFLHALYQHLWHERVSVGRQQQLHLRVGERQEAAYGERVSEIAPELAVHFEQGRDYRRAIYYRTQTAENALRRYAYQEAIAHLTRGLEFLNTLPETPERTRHELNLRSTLGITLQANRGWGNPEVEKAYARARDLCQKVKEPTQLFLVFFGLFQFHLTRAEYKTAYELTEQLLSLAQSTRDSALLVQAHGAVGVALFFLGELTSSRAQLEQSMDRYDAHRHQNHAMAYGQDPWVACQSSLAEVLWLLGYPDQALKRARESVAFAQALSHPFSLAFALYSAALVCQFRREAAALQQQADVLLTLARQQGFPLWELGARSLQGWVLADQGQGAAGVALIRQGSPERRATATAMRLPYHQARLAEAYEKANQTEEGLAQIEKALTAATTASERWWEPELYRLKGELTLKQFGVQSQHKSRQVKTGRGKSGVTNPQPPTPSTYTEAEACFLKAIEIARRQSAKSLELRAVVSLSRLWQQQGKKKQAYKMLREIYAWFTEGFDTADLQEAKILLTALA
jgi:predicted ATPase